MNVVGKYTKKMKKGLLVALLIVLSVCLLVMATAAGMLWYSCRNGLQLQLLGGLFQLGQPLIFPICISGDGGS